MGTVLDIDLAPYGKRPDGSAFGPNATQQRVLDWIDAKRSGEEQDHIPVLFLRGGVGSGKTRGLMAPACEMLMECPGIRIFWGRQDFADLKKSAMDVFFQVMPSELLVKKSEQYHWYDFMTVHAKDRKHRNATSRIYFNGLKDLSGLGSQEFAIIIVTEAMEISEQAYRTLKRRCRQAGFPVMILLESEAPNEGHWLTRIVDPNKEEYDKDIEVWELSTYENWDNLPLAYRGSLESMPDAWKRKYLFGKPGFIPKGRPFYEGFKEGTHTGWFDWNPYLPLILSWDFGFHHPAVSYHQQENHWRILHEQMGSEITINKFVHEVKAFTNLHFPQAQIKCYGDPACRQKKDTQEDSEKTSWQICKDAGFHIYTRASDYRTRKEIIDQKLSTILSDGKPILQVHQRCKTIIDGFLGGYHYHEEKPGKEVNSKYEIPFHDDFYSHLLNTVEYVAVNTYSPVQRHTDQQRRYAYRQRGGKPDNAGFSFGG